MSSLDVTGQIGQEVVLPVISENGLAPFEGSAVPQPHDPSTSLSTRTDHPKVFATATHGLGYSNLLAHGIAPSRDVVFCGSFITPAWGRDENSLPVNLIPSPGDDAYLNFFAVPAAAPGETILALRLQPGILDYYRKTGILDDSVKVIEVDPKVAPGGSVGGYPSTDPLALYADQGGSFDSGTHFVAVFPGIQGAFLAQSIGLEPVQSYCPDAANSKARLRESAAEFGIAVMPGVRLTCAGQIVDQNFQDTFATGAVWLKLAHGSGGDLVVKLPDARICTIRKGIDKLRASAKAAFDSSAYGIGFEEFWPEDSFAPKASAMVLERDAGELGRIELNGSCNFTLRSDGSFEILGFFRQRVDADGNYCGSQSFTPDSELTLKIVQQVRGVAKYLHQHGYAGLAGIDFMEIAKDSDSEVRVIEVNARPTMSSVCALVARKLDSEFFMNVNINAPFELKTADDISKAFTLNGVDLTQPTNDSGVVIVPLALRSMYVGQECRVPSNRAKVLVSGDSEESCAAVLDALMRQNGINLDG